MDRVFGTHKVIDVLVSARRDADAARRFFRRALRMLKVTPGEVVTDAAAVYPRVLDELIPQAWLCRSETRRCWSGCVSVFVDDAAEHSGP
jgi:transposase-like protein